MSKTSLIRSANIVLGVAVFVVLAGLLVIVLEHSISLMEVLVCGGAALIGIVFYVAVRKVAR